MNVAWHMHSLNIKWIIDTNGIINNFYNSQQLHAPECGKSNESHFSPALLFGMYLCVLTCAISCSVFRANVFSWNDCYFIVEYWLNTLYILWLTVFNSFNFVCFSPHEIGMHWMCRLSLKFSTPIAREIVRITLSVCYVQCSMKCACVRSLFPIIWMESHFMQQFIGNRFTMKMVRFQFTVSFHFIYNRLPYKSSSDCLFSNVGMSIIFGANNDEGNEEGQQGKE